MCDGFIFTQPFCTAIQKTFQFGFLTGLLLLGLYICVAWIIVIVLAALVEGVTGIELLHEKDSVHSDSLQALPEYRELRQQLRKTRYSHPVGSDMYKACMDNELTTAIPVAEQPRFKHPRPRVTTSYFYNWAEDPESGL